MQRNGQKSPLNNPVAFSHGFCNWLSNGTRCRGRHPLACRCQRRPLRLVFDKTLFVLRVTGLLIHLSHNVHHTKDSNHPPLWGS